jgi:MFS family permease
VGLAQVSGQPKISSLRIRLGGIFRKSPLGATGVIVSGITIGAHVTLTPRAAQVWGLSDGAIGLFLLVTAFGTIVLQFPLGWFSDNRDRRLALLVSCGFGVLAALGLMMARTMSGHLLTAGFLLGGFMMPLYPLALATVNDQLESDEMVEAASALYVFYGLGSMAGPLAASSLMGTFGPGALYFFIAAVLLGYITFGLLRIRLVPEFIVRGAKASYRTVPRTTLMAYKMLRQPKKKPDKEG